jgi:hypothetical protein
MADPVRLTITDHDIGGAVEDRSDQLRNVGAGILIVAIRVDDDVGTPLEAGVDANDERARKAQIALVAHDVIDANLARPQSRPIRRAIVDNQDLYLFDASDLTWDVADGRWQSVLFVEAGDLDDQLHRRRWYTRVGAARKLSETAGAGL